MVNKRTSHEINLEIPEKAARQAVSERIETVHKPKKDDNHIVKMAMAEELIQMGIPKTSAYRILNIRKP
jgi:hypothetical protein